MCNVKTKNANNFHTVKIVPNLWLKSIEIIFIFTTLFIHYSIRYF